MLFESEVSKPEVRDMDSESDSNVLPTGFRLVLRPPDVMDAAPGSSVVPLDVGLAGAVSFIMSHRRPFISFSFFLASLSNRAIRRSSEVFSALWISTNVKR